MEPLPVDVPGPPVVRELRAQDLAAAAVRHRHALPEGFFSQLGTAFLRRYLETFVHGPVAVALTAECDGVPVGHLVGTVRGGHHQWALRSCWRRLLPTGVLALWLHPRALSQFLRTRVGRYARAVARARAGTPPQPVAVGSRVTAPAALLHVAVDAGARGAGVGAALVREFEARARAAGCTSARLVTFAADGASSGAGAFYERLGWHRSGQRVDDAGRTVLVYERSL